VIEPRVQQGRALRKFLGFFQEDLGNRLIAKNPGKPLGMKHGEAKVTLRVPFGLERFKPLAQRFILDGLELVGGCFFAQSAVAP